MTPQEERDIYIETLIDTMFLSRFKDEDSTEPSRLELIITPDCNLACKYCYINKFGKQLYAEEPQYDKIIANTRAIIEWCIEEKFLGKNYSIDIFSGSIFSQQVGWDVVNTILEIYSQCDPIYRPKVISIPTNYSFILDDEVVEEVEDLLQRFKDIGIHVFLSGSIDGKYMEQNRPFKKGQKLGCGIGEHLYLPIEAEPRDDEYYEKAFAFVKKHRFGFHPMIYSSSIEMWKKNFVWFQEMMMKYNLPYHSLYLLEVRNWEWAEDQLLELYDFIKFMHHWVFNNIFKGNKDLYAKSLAGDGVNSINFLGYTLQNKWNKGIGCSIQSTLMIRLGDLHIVPCHRTSYRGLEFGEIKLKDGKVCGIKGLNTELATANYSFDHRMFPYCSSCAINGLCKYTCLGSNLEVLGDMFTPVPTVCRLEHVIVAAQVEAMLELDVFYNAASRAGHRVKDVLIYFKENLLSEVKNSLAYEGDSQ